MENQMNAFGRSLGPTLRPYREILRVTPIQVATYLASPYRLLLIVIFSALFLPHVFILNEDLSLISAFEVDPGSIVSAIESMFSNGYDMNAAYHSRYYGWTYFSINFFALLPLYIAYALNLLSSKFYLYFGIRFILFAIGLGTVLTFFEVASKVLRNKFLALVACFLFLMSPGVFEFFFFIHPETTGMLFSFSGILFIFKYNESRAERHEYYILGLTCLVLSALSKQIFFFTALPVLFLALNSYCLHHNQSLMRFMKSKLFGRYLTITTLLSLSILFFIHPYLFFHPLNTYRFQKEVVAVFTEGQYALTTGQSLKMWFDVLKSKPLIFYALILSPFTLGWAFVRRQRPEAVLYIVNMVALLCISTIIVLTVHAWIRDEYFAPIYPFFVLNAMTVVVGIARMRVRSLWLIRAVLLVGAAYFIFFDLASIVGESLQMSFRRLDYKSSVAFHVYEYIETNIPAGAKVAHDHNVAIPSTKGIVDCHYWQGCGERAWIERFDPDYVIFDESFTVSGIPHGPTQTLKKYIKDHQFELIQVIHGHGGYSECAAGDVELCLSRRKDTPVSVWKRREPQNK